MLNSFKLSLQYILPKLWLTRLAGWGASKRAGWLTKLVIDLFVKYYKVDMKEAQKPDTASYRTFNEFFVRPLRDEVRPIDTDPNVLAMIRVENALQEQFPEAKLLLQVHDELIVECPEEIAPQVAELVSEQMQSVADLKVPLMAEAKYGKSWYEAK